MLNTVLASQVTSKACHPYKETAQPEEKKGDRQSGSQPKPFLSFPHPSPPFFTVRKGQEVLKPTLSEDSESQNRAVLDSFYRRLLFAHLIIKTSVRLVWKPNMQCAFQGRPKTNLVGLGLEHEVCFPPMSHPQKTFYTQEPLKQDNIRKAKK